MTYIVVSSNEIVKAEMERPSFSAWEIINPCVNKDRLIKPFQEHCLSLPRIAIQGKHNWEVWQEVELDKDFELKPARTWTERNGEYGCAECCNRDRCDEDCDATYYRPNCPYCKGKGWFKEIPVIAIPIQPTPEREKVEEGLPRTEFLLHDIKRIEGKIINWYKKNHYSQGDSYSVRVTKKGKWAVSYSNDYPMQHGGGQEYVLSEEDFINATTQR